ncbi:MAG: zf-HC2 domain-containing protein [Chloroflexota bacterium]|nr:zf-HC2 domain-containing protein [Chloroflexota bacterium]
MTQHECSNEESLKRYADNAVEANESIQIEAHLATCDTCRVKLVNLRKLNAQVVALLNSEIVVPDANHALKRLRATQPSAGKGAVLPSIRESTVGAKALT